MNEQQIANVVAFADCVSLLESKTMVEDSSLGLLDEECDRVIAFLVERFADDVRLHDAIKGKRECLRRCREEGVNVAFANTFADAYPQPVSEEVAQAISQMKSFDELGALADTDPERLVEVRQVFVSGRLVRALLDELATISADDSKRRAPLLRAALRLADPRIDALMWQTLVTAYNGLAGAEPTGDAQRVVPPFDEREWIAVGSSETRGFCMEAWIPNGTRLAVWTELLTIMRQMHAQRTPFAGVLDEKQQFLASVATNGRLGWRVLSEDNQEVVYEWSLAGDFAAEDQWEIGRVFRGVDALYTILYASRGPFSEQVREQWYTRLRAAKLASRRQEEVLNATNARDGDEARRLLEELNDPTHAAQDPQTFFQRVTDQAVRADRMSLRIALYAMAGACLLFGEPSEEAVDMAVAAFRRSMEAGMRDDVPDIWARNGLMLARAFLLRRQSRPRLLWFQRGRESIRRCRIGFRIHRCNQRPYRGQPRLG